jgi:hypothetical protein
MADQKLSELPLATSAAAADQLYIVQSNVSKRIAVSSLSTSLTVHRLVAVDNSSSSLTLVVEVPATATSTGTRGQLAYNTTHIYLCVATNTWVRAALNNW